MPTRSRSTAWCSVAVTVAAWIAGAGGPSGAARGAEPVVRPGATRSKTIVDHAVVPAGLHCQHCRGGHCRLHGGHLAGCRDGMCEPHCPVRPCEYGFYRTSWRRWPGEGVVRTGAQDATTPVSPPASQVPTVDEESPRSAPTESDESAAEAPDAGPDAPGGADADRSAPADPGSDEPAADGPAAAEPAADTGAIGDPFPEAPARSDPAVDPMSAELPLAPAPPGEPSGAGDDVDAQADTDTAPDARTDAETDAEAAADDGDLVDPAVVPIPTADPAAAPAAMRYPSPVSRGVAPGTPAWRLAPAARQRPAGSARGR